MLIVTGHVDVAPSDVEAFAADVAQLAILTRARDGCLSYGVALEDAAKGRMLVAERWRDQAALSNHLEAADSLAFVARWHGRMAGHVRKFDAGNERSLDAD